MDGFVDSCPPNLTEVIKASSRLGCGVDKYGNNQYMCLPNIEKTGLVEFCHNGIMGLIEKGNCLETTEGKLFQSNCSGFVMGCPEIGYHSSKIYKYPACQKIDTQLHCYIADSSCLDTTTSTESLNVGKIIGIVTAVSFTLIILTVITIIVVRRRLANRRKRGLNSGDDGEGDILLMNENTTKDSETENKTASEQRTNNSMNNDHVPDAKVVNELPKKPSKSVEEQ
ncbi:uncharacterized protein LOC134252078, partial [Saccostrea cucullata]|uniref:uncharacterized protein LOC134252078 n=1 Tax=Saccostrea cuccullata TaxID=36930 RepID=UPI002ED10C5A